VALYENHDNSRDSIYNLPTARKFESCDTRVTANIG
jgi:hypothetical protein